MYVHMFRRPIPNRWPVSKPVSPYWSRLTGFEAVHVWNVGVDKFQDISWLAHWWPCRPRIFDVDRQSKPQIHRLGAPLRISSTVGFTCSYFSRRWANPTVEARDSPRRRPFVFKDEGSVLVFCVPVLFLCLSVPYSVCFKENGWEVVCVRACVRPCVHQHRHVFMFCVCAFGKCLFASMPSNCVVCIWSYMCTCECYVGMWDTVGA